jgi:hypothetical protein
MKYTKKDVSPECIGKVDTLYIKKNMDVTDPAFIAGVWNLAPALTWHWEGKTIKVGAIEIGNYRMLSSGISFRIFVGEPYLELTFITEPDIRKHLESVAGNFIKRLTVN